MSRGQVARLPQ